MWEGTVTGLWLGVLHAFLLATGGLYVLVDPIEIGVSVGRYAGLFGLIGAAIGLVVGMLLALDTRFRKLTHRQPLRPAPALLLAAYAGVWLVFLADDRIGRQVVAPTLAVLAALSLLVLFLTFLWLGKFKPRSRAVSVPASKVFLTLVLTGLLYSAAAIVRPAVVTPPVDESTAASDSTRQQAALRFSEQARGRKNKRWNLLLLTIDTLRADHLGMYGYTRLTSPVLDALAQDGIRFDRAFCPRPKTSPSVATILTGTWPARHGVHGAMQRLADDNETLAEYLQAGGWRTGAVITNGNLYPTFAFDQGFQSYAYGHSGEAAAGLSIDWLEANATSVEPWFLWVHYTNPHAPYSPPPPFDTMFGEGTSSPSSLERQIQLYDGEIRYTDTEIGRILQWIDERGLRKNTLIVFTADHGESLGEHDYYFAHGLHPYEASARIPLVFSAPGAVPAGRTASTLVTAADILPTILDALGETRPIAVQGQSLLPIVTGLADDGKRSFVMIEAGYNAHSETGQTLALRRATSKYVHRLRDWAIRPQGPTALFWTFNSRLEGGLRPDELYDLETDPGETLNLLGRSPARSRAERRILRGYAAGVYASGRRSTTAPGELDRKTYESLKSLGYL